MELKDIQNLAQLARIELSDDEQKALLKDIGPILEYVGQVQAISLGDTGPRAGHVHTVFREDADPHETGLYTDELLAEVPDTQDGYVKVKNIL